MPMSAGGFLANLMGAASGQSTPAQGTPAHTAALNSPAKPVNLLPEVVSRVSFTD